jgi:hypothetical protein
MYNRNVVKDCPYLGRMKAYKILNIFYGKRHGGQGVGSKS